MRNNRFSKGLIIVNAVLFVLLLGAGIGFFYGVHYADSPASIVQAAAPSGDLESLQLSYRNVAKTVLPSVVQIETVSIEERLP